MKIGILVYSHTGNTYSVSQKLKEKLETFGHSVDIQRIEPVDNKQKDISKIQFKTLPDTAVYDGIVFAAPVHAFSIAPVMAAYMKNLVSLGNKKVVCFVTMFFPFSWMGGLKAIDKMKKACESQNGIVYKTGIINWSGKQREKKISDLVEELSSTF